MFLRIRDWFSSKLSFFQAETISGLLLLISAAAALIMANTQLVNLYERIIHYPISVLIGSYFFELDVHFLVNEGLMAIFFFVVGMEVKRELVTGELSSPRKAAFPFLAALGGMLVPALIYYFLNKDSAGELGWGIPMATDIAFAIGVLSLVSKRVPFSLKIFLLSLAIIDDIGAVLVIALYYSQSLSGPYLAFACLTSFLILLYFTLELRNRFLFSLLAVALWVAVFNSGIHATVSGVILGFLIPSRKLFTGKQAVNTIKKAFDREGDMSIEELKKLKGVVQDTRSPLERLIPFYHPYVTFIIMPLFAFFNAGVTFTSLGQDLFNFSQMTTGAGAITLGVFLGLFLGKPIGILLFSAFGVLCRVADLPKDVTWNHIGAVGFLAGIGFTMSLFISNLSFGFEDQLLLNTYSKVGILSASLLSGLAGLLWFFFIKKTKQKKTK